MNRQEANQEIVKRIAAIVDKHPELRFGQIMSMLSLEETLFYEESTTTLKLAKWDVFKND